MARKRRKKARPGRVYHDEGEEEAFRPVALRADEVPTSLRTDFKSSGLACLQCTFTTMKTGFSRKQAMRAHLKIHTRDRRARRRGIVIAGLIIVMTGLAGTWVWLPI